MSCICHPYMGVQATRLVRTVYGTCPMCESCAVETQTRGFAREVFSIPWGDMPRRCACEHVDHFDDARIAALSARATTPITKGALGHRWVCPACQIPRDEGQQTGTYWDGRPLCGYCAPIVNTFRKAIAEVPR